MSSLNQSIIIALLLNALNSISHAEELRFTVENEVLNKQSMMTQFNKQGLNAWGLDLDELKQYQRVIQGNRKFWSPNLHPLAALGMREGVTPEERDRLAERLVHIERQRLSREIAFEKAFQAANRRHYSHIPLFQADPPVSINNKINTQTPSTSLASTYLNYYVKLPCKECRKPIQRWLKENKQIDLYIASRSDKAIRSFAKDMGISPLLVPAKVRLNKTTTAALTKAGITDLPHVEERK